MKVELLKTLKGDTEVFPAGTIFEDPLPSEIQSEIALDRGVVRVIEEPAPTPPPTEEPDRRDRTEGLQLDEVLAAMDEVEEGKPPPKSKKREVPKKKASAKKPALAKRKKK